ncbi:ATP-NAD kinase [Sulfolobus acidocaldarius SUSAZ]|nr:ATP-NAD kinase [Sulfolobus acidocaldarius SUSAZ]
MNETICLLVNPVAGSGGRIGHKGSDDLRFYNPEIHSKMERFLSTIPKQVKFIVPPGIMGEVFLKKHDFKFSVINIHIGDPTTRQNTIEASKMFLELECKIIVFAGGDGTARDIYSVVKDKKLLLGIPTGVKMHSGIFANTPEDAGHLIRELINERVEIVNAEILDIDEEQYRKGKYDVKLYGYAKTISFSTYLTPSKTEIYSEQEELNEITDYLLDNVFQNHPEAVFIIGPGSTTKYIMKRLGYETNFLCTDVVIRNKLIGSCVSYNDLLSLTGELKLIVTPIGGQGFLLGRGNQEIGPGVLKRVNKDDIIVISSRRKLQTFECLRIDTGDPEVDKKFLGIYKVIIGYNEFKPIKICNIT